MQNDHTKPPTSPLLRPMNSSYTILPVFTLLAFLYAIPTLAQPDPGSVIKDDAAATPAEPAPPANGLHKFTVQDIDGKDVDLDTYADQVVLVVNVASRCGYTRQYKDLVALHDAYKDKNFSILAFPANNFGGQEPGTNAEIKDFCASTYDVAFPMMAKVSVKGDDQAPLFKFLTAEGGDIRWNFEKILVGKDGDVIKRYKSRVDPDSADVQADIDKALK